MDCPACRSEASPWARCPRSGRSYFRCPSCGLVFLDPALRLSASAERERYLLHRNSAEDEGFRAYLGRFIDDALSPYLGAGASVLDYGSGPSPVLSLLLSERGYRPFSWDPFFSPERPRAGSAYAAAAMHEVIEHCADPAGALEDAASFLEPGGILAVSTLWRPDEPDAFLRWWYREDQTHLCFFTPDCLALLADRVGLVELKRDERSAMVFRRR